MSLSSLLIAHFHKWTVPVSLMVLMAAALGAASMTPGHEIGIGKDIYRVELATTAEARSKGLMFRRSLDPYGGMLLVYREDGDHRIWMKNVPIALRVYWIDNRFKVIGALRLPPCEADPCPVYAASSASRYVLELSDRDHPLQVGDLVRGLDGL